MMNLRENKEALYSRKEEGDGRKASITAGPCSSRQWSSSGLKNPRIVRVCRSFGGKDRHSKVCTIKGLRDRRIRLSVPTAIQLYDLQDRLGLGQPSKVIDWLLDITKHDIDKLPPLPAIPGSFPHFQQDTTHGASHLSSSNPFLDANLFPFMKEGSININRQNEDPSIVAKFKYWDASNASMRSKQKEVDDNDQAGIIGESNRGNSQVLAQNFFPIATGGNNNHPSTFLSNSNSNSNSHQMYNYYHWEPSNLSLTHQLGNHGLISSQNDHQQAHPSNSTSLPSPLALSSGSQLFVSPSMASTSSLFPPHASYLTSTLHPQVDNDIRQFNRFHVSNYPFTSPLYTSNGLGLKPFPLSMTHHSQLHQNDDDDHHHDKND